MADKLPPDLDMARRHLTLLAEDAETFVFQTFDDSKRKDPSLARVLHGTFDEHKAELARAQARGAGVFVTVNRSKNGRRRKEDIGAYRAIWREADEPDLPALPLEPHFVIESSPGKYHEYIVIEHSEALDTCDGIMERMVQDYGSDPCAKDRSRVLRLAGFYHLKDPANPHLVEITHESGGLPYTLEKIVEAIPPLKKSTKAAGKKQTTTTPSPRAYGQAALVSELGKLATASEGMRNDQLNKSTFALGSLVAGGELDRGTVEAALMGTALSLGLTESEARATIRSGFEAGSKEPRTAPESGRRETTTTGETEAPDTPSPLRGLRPSSDIELYDRPEVENPALLASLVFIARLHILSAYMKSGKTEFLLQMIHAILRGDDFIGLPTKKARVLLVTEMAETDVLKTFRKLGHTPEGSLFIHGREAGPFVLDKEGMEQLNKFVHENNIGLVVIDVISRFWLVADENSATEVEKALLPLLQLCGSTEAAVLMAHHETKAGGEHGRGIRGSGGIFGTVDQAIILSRHGTSRTQRVLKTLGRFPESPDELLLDYIDERYVAIGSMAETGGLDFLVRETLGDEPMTISEISAATGLHRPQIYKALRNLEAAGEVLKQPRHGTGGGHVYTLC